MPDETLTFVVPMPANRANLRSPGAWRKHKREKDAYWDTLDTLQLLHGATSPSQTRGMAVPPPPSRPWPAATVAVIYFHTHEMDEDNAVARFKHVADWLTTRGYITDDNKRALQWAGFPRQVKCKRAEVRVEVTLTKRAQSDAA